MRLLSESVRERVLAEAYEELHAEKAFVARKGEPARSWIGVVEGLLKAGSGFSNGKTLIYSGIPAGSWIGEGSVLRREVRRDHQVEDGARAGGCHPSNPGLRAIARRPAAASHDEEDVTDAGGRGLPVAPAPAPDPAGNRGGGGSGPGAFERDFRPRTRAHVHVQRVLTALAEGIAGGLRALPMHGCGSRGLHD